LDESLALTREIDYDVVLLDMDIPGNRGIETCRELRRLRPRAAILTFGDSADREHLIEALNAGADYHLARPLNIREVSALAQAALRRLRTWPALKEETVAVGDIELDPARRLVRKSGQIIHLTPKEFDLLHCLIEHAGSPVTHSRLMHTAWGAGSVNEFDCLRTFIRQLRKKIESNAARPEYLLTDSRIGYRFAGARHQAPAALESRQPGNA
jgi:two-component system KDP operon response regulator KdpE